MKRNRLIFNSLSLSLFSLFLGPSAPATWAQTPGAGPLVTLDFQTTSADTQTQSTLETAPVIAANRFTATLVVQGAADLMFFSTEMVYNPAQIRVVEISEDRGDLNFDGRNNIADVLTLGEVLGLNVTTGSDADKSYALYDFSANGLIDAADVSILQPIIQNDLDNTTPDNETRDLYWTCNPDTNLALIRESADILEFPSSSNTDGRLEAAVTLLPRPDVRANLEAFGFTGDARMAQITFEVVESSTGTAQIGFENSMIHTEATFGNAVNPIVPESASITIPLQ